MADKVEKAQANLKKAEDELQKARAEQAKPAKPANKKRMATHFIPTSRLKAYDVVGEKGEKLGQVDRIIVDMCSGQVAYMLVGIGAGDKWLAMPPEILTWQADKHAFELDVPRQMLDKAPGVKKADWPDKFLDDLEKADHTEWLKGVYEYYDATPFWLGEVCNPDTGTCVDVAAVGVAGERKPVRGVFDPNAPENQPAKTHFIPTSHLKVYDIVNDKGEDLGQVQNFIIDMVGARVAYVLVSFEGFIGIGDKWIALPFEILTWLPDKEKFELDVPRKKLEQAPGIKKSDWPDRFLADLEESDHARWVAEVYEYFDRTPFWVEETVITQE